MAFRELVRKKQQLSQEECIALLQQERRGVLSVLGDGGYPYGLPMNHYYCPEDGKLYFHSGMTGHKVDALRRNSRASFCVCEPGQSQPGEWALDVRSVVVFGRVELVEDWERAMEMTRRLSERFTDDAAYIAREIEQSGRHTLCFALVPEHMTGKRVHEA